MDFEISEKNKNAIWLVEGDLLDKRNNSKPKKARNPENDKNYSYNVNNIPSKQLLLYMVRMGSFTSSQKFPNEDSQDNGVIFSDVLHAGNILALCNNNLSDFPEFIPRSFQDVFPTTRETIRVMQWNVLSQALSTGCDHFIYAPENSLQWDKRRYRLLQEICNYLPDVICLQEVDHFRFLETALSKLEFRGIFFPKPDSACYYIEGNNGPDGCALFYCTKKLSLLNFRTRILKVWNVESNQICIVARMKLISHPYLEFLVAVTHLKAREGTLMSSLRLEEGKDVLDFILSEREKCPILLCGDFNATPDEPVYTLMTKCFKSAYAFTGSEPSYTTWKMREEGETKATHDYIFYTEEDFSVSRLLELYNEEQIGIHRLPSLHYPSDHLSLVADFGLG